MKIAVLSNVNMNALIRLLAKTVETYAPEGYGNELGILMNPSSSYHAFDPEWTFLVMDLMELLEHDPDPERADARMDAWFSCVQGVLAPGKTYYISDAWLRGAELDIIHDPGRRIRLESMWQQRLEKLCGEHGNVRVLPCRRMINGMGEENAFSRTMWYMGRIPFSVDAQKRLCGLILDKLRIESGTPGKLLILDLDNTLWGGLAGENDHTPVVLSEEHGGLAYKDLQRVILQMQKQGVLLAIVSRNNEADAMEIIEKHPHMILRADAFAAKRINWKQKHENIREIAAELNLGLDSFVFWDDSPVERQLVKEMLPQVAVPDFPARPEDMAPAMVEVYREYFAKPSLTKEDLAKTAQYAANEARDQLRDSAGSFEEYLKNLKITAVRVRPERHMERLVQLVNKTNQFNLTAKRYTRAEMEELVKDPSKRVYLYEVSDRFGDSGIVAAAAVDCAGEIPVLEELTMSCRVMGRNIEFALVEDIEKDLRICGYRRLKGIFIPTARNNPVKNLYPQLGYEKTADLPGGGAEYEIALENTPKRMYYVETGREEE